MTEPTSNYVPPTDGEGVPAGTTTGPAGAETRTPTPAANNGQMSLGAKIGMASCGGCLLIVVVIIAAVYGMLDSYNAALRNSLSGPDRTAKDKTHYALAKPVQDQFKKSVNASAYFTQNRSAAEGAWGPLECGSNVDYCYLADSADFAAPESKTACTNFLALAGSYPLTTYYDVAFKAHPMTEQPLADCMATLNGYSRSVGWGLFSNEFLVTGKTATGVPFGLELSRVYKPTSILQTNPTPTPTSTPWVVNNSLPSGTYTYGIITSTLFDYPKLHEEVADLTSARTKIAAYLDLLTFYRGHSSEADQFSMQFNQNVLTDFVKAFPTAKTWTLQPAAGGKTYMLNVKDPTMTVCVGIGVDSMLAKADFPSGLPRGSTGELTGLANNPTKVITKDSQFGDYALGACK